MGLNRQEDIVHPCLEEVEQIYLITKVLRYGIKEAGIEIIDIRKKEHPYDKSKMMDYSYPDSTYIAVQSGLPAERKDPIELTQITFIVLNIPLEQSSPGF